MDLFTASIEIVKLLLDPLTRQINYIRKLPENLEDLKKKIGRLMAAKKDVNKEIDRAKLERKDPTEVAKNWLQRMEDLKDQVNAIEREYEENKRCFGGCLPNYKSRRKLGKRTLKLIDELAKHLEEKSTLQIAVDELPSTLPSLPIPPLLSEKTVNEYKQKILDCIKENGTRKIGIYGMGGVGKTTIMKLVNNHLKDAELFENIVWVTVSKTSTLKMLQSKIADEINFPMGNDSDERSRSIKLLQELEKRKSCIFILDDMWTKFFLFDIGIPEPTEANGFKIVLTTRSLNVCKEMETQKDINVKVLPKDEAWALFSSKVGNDALLSEEIQEVAKLVALECKGLPLALITVGLALRKVGDIRVWNNALKELTDATPSNNMYEDVFKPLKFSYDCLPDPKVQACFLYCSLYPEDDSIPEDELIDLWICEGLINDAGNLEAEKNKGYAILHELKCACMLESEFKRREHVKMHDLVRDMAICITRDIPRFMVKTGLELKEQPREEEWVEDIERISLSCTKIVQLAGEPNCHKLLTLFLINNWQLRCISSSFFRFMHSLRVLNLSFTKIESLPESISDLVNLQALLIECSELEHVPSLLKLKELRMLNLKGTCIEELPPGMEGLINLRYLDLSVTKELKMFRAGILPKLSLLEDLQMLGSRWRWRMINEEGESEINEITGLTHLRKVSLNFNDLSAFSIYVGSRHWSRLQKFDFRIGERNYLYPLLFGLSRVALSACDSGSNEGSLLLPSNTERVDFFKCRGIVVLSQFLSAARGLKACRIDDCEDLEYISANEENSLLQSLEKLEVSKMSKLRAISNGVMPNGALTCLKHIKIYRCHMLKNLFSLRLLQSLGNLETIWIANCNLLEVIIDLEGECGGVLPKLKSLYVSNCPNLKTVFSSELFQSLQNVEDECNAMEQMAAEEEQEEEICEDDYVTRNSIELPKLRVLGLLWVPYLKCICRSLLICNSLESFELRPCPQLKNLPLSVENPTSRPVEGSIYGTREWWDALEWNNPKTKQVLQHLFKDEEEEDEEGEAEDEEEEDEEEAAAAADREP